MLEDEDDHQEVVEVAECGAEVEALEGQLLTQTTWMTMLAVRKLLLWWSCAVGLQVVQHRWSAAVVDVIVVL